ncbi:MAG: Fis family transcriptional regulator, partial [Oxalobacter sp.]|nr:Fis family transcriptional regulator [Oxalobacter sp.]
NIYNMIIRTVEKPMLMVVMKQAGFVQSKAADMLGINRNTLRKKLAEHNLLDMEPL